MKKVQIKDVKPYAAAKHYDCSTLKLHGREETGSVAFWMGVSHYLPGGGEADTGPVEKCFFVLEGEVTVYNAAKEAFVLRKWDSLQVQAGEERTLKNETNFPATVLVVIPYPDMVRKS